MHEKRDPRSRILERVAWTWLGCSGAGLYYCLTRFVDFSAAITPIAFATMGLSAVGFLLVAASR